MEPMVERTGTNVRSSFWKAAMDGVPDLVVY